MALDSTQDSPHSTPQTSLQNYKKLDYESISDDEKSEGYVFHILSDFVSDDSRQKLSNLAKELSKIYPCEIIIHICDDSVFYGTPKFKGNYLTWFRIFITDFLPNNVSTCLYLDTDMFVFRDLRELFTLDLQNKYAGVVKWFCGMAGLFAKDQKNENFYFKDNFYFNAGFLLFNLDECRKHDLKNKVLDFANKYQVNAPDQDALNGIIRKENALILPYEYNIIISYYCPNAKAYLRYGCGYIPLFDYTAKEIDFAYSNPIIWHFVGTKIWESEYVALDSNYKPLGFIWWQTAWNAPFFKDELKALFATKRDNYLVCKDFGLYVASLIDECSKSFVGYVKMPFIVYSAFRAFDLNHNYTNDFSESLDKNVAFELLSVAVRAWGRKNRFERIAKFIILPFRIYRTKNRCKKGIYKAQKGNAISGLYV